MLNSLNFHDIGMAILALGGLALLIGVILGFAAIKFKVEGNPLVHQIDQLLPQTQCGQCGYPGCRPYAEAIAKGDTINKCPPGGQATVNQLANLLGVDAPALDAPDTLNADIKKVAFIREEDCIGCTKCILACPVDAILGAAKQMHTVIISECTGCDLCVEPCPVDCIDMIELPSTLKDWGWQKPALAFSRDVIASDRSRENAA